VRAEDHFEGKLEDGNLPCVVNALDDGARGVSTAADILQDAVADGFDGVVDEFLVHCAALEAEACGLPVVASDLPGVRTVVLQGQTGTLVPPGDVGALRDAIDLLRLDPPARSRLAEAATAHATSFVWEKHIDGLIQVYREVCA